MAQTAAQLIRLTLPIVPLHSSSLFTNNSKVRISDERLTNLFIFRFRVSQASVASKSPRESPVTLVNGDGVVITTRDLLDDNSGDGSDTFRLGILLDVHYHFGRYILIVKGHFASLLQKFPIGVVAKLPVLGVSYNEKYM